MITLTLRQVLHKSAHSGVFFAAFKRGVMGIPTHANASEASCGLQKVSADILILVPLLESKFLMLGPLAYMCSHWEHAS